MLIDSASVINANMYEPLYVFRMAYVHLTSARLKGQSEVRAPFKCEYVVNGVG